MEKKEFYKQKTSPKEDLERLKKIEYPNLVSETILDRFPLEGKKMLDSGSGPNTGLAEYVAGKGGMYVPLELRTDTLSNMQQALAAEQVPFYGVQGDVRNLPFADDTFDLVHQRFVFMNILPETRAQSLRELLRVGKRDFVFLEYDWGTLSSNEDPDRIERFRTL
ncbi:MAG: class I SAM-dependent methyltransferase, partial [Patescibacteria group bacterium]|nr:class I SAM-dependent methyltransferase [Patescibacteria group bacterium]